MSGCDTVSTASLQQRLADTEEALAALRLSFTREQERYNRTKALLEAWADSPEAPAWPSEDRHADTNLWWYQDQIGEVEIRIQLCLRALKSSK